MGDAEAIAPGVRRVLAPNASTYTYTGTQTYIVGHGAVAVIDPGPTDPAHVAALLAATAGERIAAILCTHTHRDHSPAAALLKAATGAEIVGCAALAAAGREFDHDYAPDRVLADGETLRGDGWTIAAVATPGHTSNHLCFALNDSQALFSGDHVMGWSTSVVIPPDGDMGDYVASLERLVGREERVYYPGHGEPIADPQRLVRAMIGHRRHREAQILRLLGEGATTVPDIAARAHAGIAAGLVRAAEASVLAHLIELERRGLVAGMDAIWRVA